MEGGTVSKKALTESGWGPEKLRGQHERERLRARSRRTLDLGKSFLLRLKKYKVFEDIKGGTFFF